NVLCLYPNRFQSNNRIAGEKEITIPDPDDEKFKIRIGTPVGKELLKAIVTKKPLATLDRRAKADKPGQPLQLSHKEFGRLAFEAMRLKTDEDTTGSVQDIKEQARKKFFTQFQKEAKEWAEHTIDLVTLKKDDDVEDVRR